MDDRRPAPPRFEFQVTATGTMAIDGADARQARDWLVSALRDASATIATGPACGLTLVGLRPSDDVVLLRIDAVDPVAALAAAIRAFRARNDEA